MPARQRRRALGVVLHEDIGAYLLHIAQTAERHGDIEFLADDVEGFGHTGLAQRAEAVDVGAADEDAFGAQRQSLDDVLSGANSTVHQDLDPAPHAAGDLRQCRYGRGGAVELAAAVVGDDDGIGTTADRKLGILRVEDALEDELAAPALLDAFDVVPIEAWVKLFGGPGGERTRVLNALGVADNVAEGAPLGAEHAQPPARFAGNIDDVGERHLRRRG